MVLLLVVCTKLLHSGSLRLAGSKLECYSSGTTEMSITHWQAVYGTYCICIYVSLHYCKVVALLVMHRNYKSCDKQLDKHIYSYLLLHCALSFRTTIDIISCLSSIVTCSHHKYKCNPYTFILHQGSGLGTEAKNNMKQES